MALRWKPTIPDDKNPEDVVGSLHLHVFARVYRIQSGKDQGRFRWYLKDVPPSAGVQLQGLEDTQREAQQAANLQFQLWLRRAGLREAPLRAKKQLSLPFHLNLKSGNSKRPRNVSLSAQSSAK
ncbi:hypothetical protein J4G37_24860 [Microvirga sp. 3-52]|nr:hypothetical protein [Microvirga sp. 3-52]